MNNKKIIIEAYKKVLSNLTKQEEININLSSQKYFGGYSEYKFDKFSICQMLNSRHLSYNKTKIVIDYKEWCKLRKLTISKKNSLAEIDENIDIINLKEILKK